MFPIAIKAVYLLVLSYHTVCGAGCNQNNNPVIGVELMYDESTYIALALPNSHSIRTVLVAKKEKGVQINQHMNLGYFYGGVTGYADIPLPFVSPMLTTKIFNIENETTCLSDFKSTVCVTAFKYVF